MEGPLENPFHEAFCQYYVFGHPSENGGPKSWREKPRRNATWSYIGAGSTSTGNAAATGAARVLRRPEVQRRIKELEELRRLQHGDDS